MEGPSSGRNLQGLSPIVCPSLWILVASCRSLSWTKEQHEKLEMKGGVVFPISLAFFWASLLFPNSTWLIWRDYHPKKHGKKSGHLSSCFLEPLRKMLCISLPTHWCLILWGCCSPCACVLMWGNRDFMAANPVTFRLNNPQLVYQLSCKWYILLSVLLHKCNEAFHFKYCQLLWQDINSIF